MNLLLFKLRDTLFTQPRITQILIVRSFCSVMLANVSISASVDVTARLQVSAGGFMTSGHLAKEITIAADSTLELIPNKLVLKRNEKLHLQASVDNRLEATISVLEIT